jgi:diguanylate cyclase (GGDEF)-like protein
VILKDALDVLKTALENVEQAARADDKTPLQNALALNESKSFFALGDESPNIIIFADIDDFKTVNEQYGSAIGDAAINQVGVKIQELFVEKLKALGFRQSGDEFVLLIQEKFINEFKEAASYFGSCPVQVADKSFNVKMSFGYITSDGTLDFETLRSNAETACKQAKSLGGGFCLEWTAAIEQNNYKL